jgi:alkyldihydroxyacetonephosphate synthase
MARRWNGWGEEGVELPLAPGAVEYLHKTIGEGTPAPDARLEEVLAAVPPSRLWDNPWISTDPGERVLHARGQSLPDWVALRSGQIGAVPDGVAYPGSEADLRSLFEFAAETEVCLIPYGGGTSVVGHINPLPGERPLVTVDMQRMDQLLDVDRTSMLATFGAGARGPQIEASLRPRGFTLGHFPQSFEYSTLGGWIATRSSGQQSYYYGRIEDLFAGGHIETPAGPLDLPTHPASAAGPDLRQLFLGSEGRMGVITRAVVRLRPLPEKDTFYGVLFRQWEAGVAAVRAVAQASIALSMMRLSDPLETEVSFVLAGMGRWQELLERTLNALGYPRGRCLLIFATTGSAQAASRAKAAAMAIFRRHGALPAVGALGEAWRKNRFRSPYLRNTLWELGYAVDTLEPAVPWSSVEPLADALRQGLQRALRSLGERGLIMLHLSHIYPTGASLYLTAIFRRGRAPDETLLRWKRLKTTANRIIIQHGGTISHQHGVGLDHLEPLAQEKGPLGLALLQATLSALDPYGMMNPGKLLPREEPPPTSEG